MIHKLCTQLGISWETPSIFRFGNHSFDIASAAGTPAETARQHHLLRDLIHAAAWSCEATRRPKDFDGAQNGIACRKELSAIMHCPSGPSLLCGGHWTRVRRSLAFADANPTCLRCDSAPETHRHMLWECPAGLADRQHTFSCIPGFDPLALPPCLQRCGLVPEGFSLPGGHDPLIITRYLLRQVQDSVATSSALLPDTG